LLRSQGFRDELARRDHFTVKLGAVSTRLFFISIWVAGTVAASSLGWTAVALVAQRVGDQPRIEALELLAPAQAQAVEGPAGQAAAQLVTPVDDAVIGGQAPRDLPESSDQRSSNELEFDHPWAIGDSGVATTDAAQTTSAVDAGNAANGVAAKKVTNQVPPDSSGTPSTTASVRSTAKLVEPKQVPTKSTLMAPKNPSIVLPTIADANVLARPLATEVRAKEIHANPGKAFGTSPTTSTTKPSPDVQAAAVPAPKTRPSKATKTLKPPIPLANSQPAPGAGIASPNDAAAVEQFETSNSNAALALAAPNDGAAAAPATPSAESPPVLIITTPPVPVVPAAGLPAQATSATIPASAIVMTTSPPSTPANPPTLPTIASPVVNSSNTSGATPVSSTTTKPVAVGQQAYKLSNGSVGVHCAGNQIFLDFATPSEGATVKVESSGPEKIELTFKSSEGGSERSRSETEFSARCVGGSPVRGN
jgi:hypothetical protein